MEQMTSLLWLLLVPLIIIDVAFLLEVLVGLPSYQSPLRATGSPRTVILIPAHNEGQVIGTTIEALKIAAGEKMRILVVADNCDDDTAAVVRALGIDVVERTDASNRGKGYALAFGREWLSARPPELVIVLDADCSTDAKSLQNLSAACLESGKPCQAINLLRPSKMSPPMVQISSFAFLLKNLIRQRGLQRLTGGVHLTGTGMCLPWWQFEQADLATASIVEDVRLGLEMARNGVHPQLVPTSFVWSEHADLRDTLAQRSRWEGGFLSLARTAGPKFIFDGLKQLQPGTVFRGLDLMIPPLAMLGMWHVVAILFAASLAAGGWAAWVPAGSLTLLLAALGTALTAAWWAEGRKYITIAALLKLPLYGFWKLPMYFELISKGVPSHWLRTARRPRKDPEV